MIVRNAVAEDIPAITEIYGQSVLNDAASFEIDPPDADEMVRRWTVIIAAGYPYLVACDDNGSVAGYAYASAYRPRPAYGATVENSVYVSLNFRRRGVARLLLEALMKACRAHGARQMVAVIGDRGTTGSMALHEALGFRHVGTLEKIGCKFDRWIDVVLMQKEL